MGVTLVIGGSGFIGSHAVEALLGRGHRVRVLDTRPPDATPAAEFITGDLADDAALGAALEGADRILHAAGRHLPATSEADPAAEIADHVLPAVRLLHRLRGGPTRRFVYVSSGGTVYGAPERLPVPEAHPLRPVCAYGAARVAVEAYIGAAEARHGLSCAILRPANPYGPRQRHVGTQGVIRSFLECHRWGRQPELWGDGAVVRDFLHVTDLARLCALALESEARGCFNAGSGEGVSVREVLSIVESVTGRRIPPLLRPARGFDVPRSVLDIRRARSLLGWSPQIPLAQGIAGTWAWLQAQPVPG